MSLRWLCAVVCLFAFACPSLAQNVTQFKAAGQKQSVCRFGGGPFQPLQSAGFLLSPENGDSASPLICAMGKTGAREAIPVSVPDAKRIRIGGAAAGPDGELALIGIAQKGDRQLDPFLLWISPDRQQRITTALSPYFPDAVTIAADGNVWLAGYQNKPNGVTEDNYKVIRRYSAAGKLLGSMMPKIKAKGGSGGEPSDDSRLVASGDRVGWYPRTAGPKAQYYEFALNGDEMSHYKLVPADENGTVGGVAMSPANTVLVARTREGRTELLQLDREEKTWNPVALPAEGAFQLLGFDGPAVLITADTLATIRAFTVASN